MAAVPPEEALRLLERRSMILEAQVAAADSMLQNMERSGLPRPFGVESEYIQAVRRAELTWVRQIINDMGSGKLEWPEEALQLHKNGSGEERP